MRNLALAIALGAILLLPGQRPPAVEADAPLSFTLLGTFADVGGEIADATPNGRYLAVTVAGDELVRLVDLDDPKAPTEVCSYDTSEFGEPTSVAVSPDGKYALVAVKNDPDAGHVVAFSIPGCDELWDVEVGIGPDAIAITRNGALAVVAIEAEVEVDDPFDCPAGNGGPGRVDLIELPRGAKDEPVVIQVPIDLGDVDDVNCPDDPQPESVAISPDGKLAYVTLQENNALATIDLRTKSVASVIALGVTSHLADTDDDGDKRANDPFTGRRESDGIATSHDGRWLFLADEGDTETTESPTVFSGGRTMTVLSAARFEKGRGHNDDNVLPPEIETDTKAQIETLVFENDAPNRPEDRGPEPEGLTVLRVGGQELAAVGLERSNALIIFDVSNPEKPKAIEFIPTGRRPEGVVYLSARRLLITANETDADLTIICVKVGGSGCK